MPCRARRPRGRCLHGRQRNRRARNRRRRGSPVPDARFAGAGDVREESGPALAVESGENGRIVLFTTLDVTREEANAALRAARLSGLSSVAGVRRLDALPVLGSGKIDYRKLRALCADERNMA